MDRSNFNPEGLKAAAPMIFAVAGRERGIEGMRRRIAAMAQQMEFDTFYDYGNFREGSIIRVRDCAQVFRSMLTRRSEDLAGFSIAKAIRDTAQGRPRPDLTPAFYAEMIHVLLGLQGRGPGREPADDYLMAIDLSGREAAVERSRQLDDLWNRIEDRLGTYPTGLSEDAVARRKHRRRRILDALGAEEADWSDWHWQVRNVIRDAETLGRLIALGDEQRTAVEEACSRKVPFGITPYYLALMDEEPGSRDRSIRAQVFPPMDYVSGAALGRECDVSSLDFMLEEDTSPRDLITRRYPAIVVFKPYNTCPQICVYCQRNWEIDGVMAPGALAGPGEIDGAVSWIREHPAVHEVLVTGGDPLALSDERIEDILERIAAIPTIERIRIGTRTLVTMPMRFTDPLCRILGKFREPGKREIVVVTHVQHPYEITPDVVRAAERIRTQGIDLYNQIVYTFFVSRRFEAAALRRAARLAGIAPYYTFNTKGKDETRAYRVPMARLLQEQKEEARLLTGMVRTDEAVYNVPGLGKNYLRARQHRDILSVLPDGSRVYEFHPWEKNVSGTGSLQTYIHRDIPILEFLERLETIGEDVTEYETIWYYF